MTHTGAVAAKRADAEAGRPPARRAPARAAAPPPVVLQRCACGGGCPRCRGAEADAGVRVSRPGDPDEAAAERMADAALGSAPTRLRRSGGAAGGDAALPPALDGLRGGGRPLPDAVRADLEPRFGADFGAVRVHADAPAAGLAERYGAQAFTVGRDIAFGAGRYAPETAAGRRLLAHELAHTLQQGGAAPRLQRSCGPPAIGTPAGCTVPPLDYGVWVPGQPFRFEGGCDDFSPGQAAALSAYVAGLGANTTFEIHGFASVDGDPGFNHHLACARALAAQALLTGGGISPSRITVFNHGETPGPTADRRSVVIRAATTHHFRVAAASFLSCALCNPFTDDGALGVTPPTAEPAPGSSFRQKHHVEAELVTLDSRTISRAGLLGTGNHIGVSGFCGTSRRAHVVSFAPAGAPRLILSAAHGEGIEFESELTSRVQALLPPTFPGSPCGLTGTNPMIPVIGNTFRMRLFADGTKESEFVGASLYPSHFLYEDGTLKLFGGAPVHPLTDFFGWSTSTGVPLAATLLGFKALRFACCSPWMSSFLCNTLCVGGITAPSPGFDARTCGAHAARLALASCPTPCAPAGGTCTPLVLPSNP